MKCLLLSILLLPALPLNAALNFSASQTTGVQAFSATLPVDDWSTATISGAAGTLTTIAQVDAAAQARTAASVSTALGTQAANPTNALAQRSSNSNFIYTAATGNNATLLMATLQNGSGAPVNAVTIVYDQTRIGSATEESMGHRVFYSLTGLANSWTLIPALSNIDTNQALSKTVTFSSAWANGASLYILWIDDNGSGTDTPFTIDNFVVTQPAPTVALTAPTAGASAFSPGSFNLAATATDDGSVAKVEFLRGGSVIHTDTTSPYEFTDSSLQVGSYSYTARATDNLGAVATSPAVAVTVTLDPGNLPANTSLAFDGVNDHVTMGVAPQLNAGGPPGNGFTLECWFRRDGTGITSSSGSGGVTAVPLFGKGRGEGDGANIDCNYFFGITTGGILVADFEAYPATGVSAGQNYPIIGTNTPITNGVWNHAAVTYDMATFTWKMYLNGTQVGNATAVANAAPRFDSIQHFGLASAFNSSGAAEGAFAGRLDEVRVWNVARTSAEIQATKDVAIISATGLVGCYGLNEGTGTATANSVATTTGTLTNGTLWAEGAPLANNDPPTVSIIAPADNASFAAPAGFTITADASDSDGTVAGVEFFENGIKLGVDTTAPYTFDVTGYAQGAYSFTARATDNFGAFSNSAAVPVSITAPQTTPPTISITAPASGATFLAPATITIDADASDSDGTVTKVEFFNGSTKLGEDETAPYSFTWSGVGIGTYSLTAIATDNMTAPTTSSPIAVTVILNQEPSVSLTAPADLTTNVGNGGTVSLSANVADPEGQPLNVTFYGRPKSLPVGPDFTLVTLPDTQFYSQNTGGSRFSQFLTQTNWIVANKSALKVAFVAHMGDMVQNGDSIVSEWDRADQAMDIIEDPATTLLTQGIPWGGAPGNHDFGTGGGTGTTNRWNEYFGTSRWSGKPYFQGNYGSNNNNNVQFFSASGLDFMVINLAYNSSTSGDLNVMNWADALMKAHPNRRAIVTSHWLIGTSFPPTEANFGGHGQAVYDNLKDNPNFFMMLCGHIHGEGRRDDVYEGRTVYTILQDYQDRSGAPGGFGGGDGWLRYFVFSPANNTITAKTYRPTSNTTGTFETDADSEFILPYTMGAGTAAWTALGTVTASSGTASLEWIGLAGSTEYEWYAAVSDGTNNIGSGTRGFTSAPNVAPTVVLISPAESDIIALPAQVSFAATAVDSDGAVSKVEFYAGATKVGEDMNAPFTFDWTAISGTHALTAIAIDNQGATATSAIVNITVTNPFNVSPTVSITAPTDGFSTEATTLGINATAADSDGNITKVEFFHGATKLGEDATSPFSFNWSGISVGTYSLTAVATDNDGAATISEAISVTFTPPGNFVGSLMQNFNSMGTAGITPPGTWTVWNGASGTSNSSWVNSVLAADLPGMALMTSLTAVTTPSSNNNSGFNAAGLSADTTNRVLASAPTTNAGMAFQLLMTNGTGLPITALKLSYDTLRYTTASSTNQLPGYWLFASFDGGTSWTNISALNPTITTVPNTVGTTDTGPTIVSLGGTWNAESQMLLRWVDDNAQQTSPDQIIGLDNVSIVLPTPIESWKVVNIGNANASLDSDVIDSDGLPLLLEYAFGLNPNLSDNSAISVDVSNGILKARGLPITHRESSTNAEDFRALFIRRKNAVAAGLIYIPMFSEGLNTWQNATSAMTVIASDAEVEVVSVPFPSSVNGSKSQFFRVGVTQN